MISDLVWIPATGGGTQTIQFQIQGTSTWITYSTVGPTVNNLGITGLNYNTVYNYQVINNCPTGSTTTVSGESYVIQCVSQTITPSSTAAQVQFFSLGGTIDTYTVNLLNASTNAIIATNVLSGPFPASITTTFTNLTALTNYSIQVIPSSFGFSNNTCTTVAFTTTNTPTCPPPTGMAVVFSAGSPTNATLTWIPQSNIVAQEVWYGALSAVGSTLPPATGWNPGSNLYSSTAASATLNNLNVNTQYQFATLTHCTTGQSSWAMLTGYKLVCPTVSTAPTSTSVAVTLSTLNATSLATIVNTLSVALVQVSSGNTISTATYSGSGILPVLANTFTGLTAATAYNVIVSYTLVSGGASTICSTTAVSTAAVQTCPVITFSTSNVTTTGFTVTPAGLQSGDTYDVSIDGGHTFPYTNATQPSFALAGLATGTTYAVVVRRDCANSLTSVTPSQQITTANNNFIVTDVWYNCTGPGGASCTGQAVWCSVATVKQTSNNAVIYNYANNPSIPNGFSTFLPGLVPGTQYTVTSTWVINGSKTLGISAVFLTGNTVSQNWATTQATVTESITFTAAATNIIQVQCSSRGPICSSGC